MTVTRPVETAGIDAAIAGTSLISPIIFSVYAKVQAPNKSSSKNHIRYDFRSGHDAGAYKGGEMSMDFEAEKFTNYTWYIVERVVRPSVACRLH